MVRATLDAERKTLVDQTINGYFERSIDYATRIDSSYRQLWETLYDLIRSGGKRLRPQMTLMAYEAFGGKDINKMIPVAAAQELLHFCLLIHDDVIDRDYVRYGTLNVAGRYKVTYAQHIDSPEDQIHFAHSAAILGGDLMLSAAHQLVASSVLADADKLTAQGFLSHSVFEVAGGELLDTELSFVPYTDGAALKVARYKTAGYSFVTPLLTGATIAGIDEEQTEALNDYARSLGIAYQLVDDLLGVFGSQEQTGKSASSDITEGKRTYMVEQAQRTMNPEQRESFNRSFGNPDATDVDIDEVRQLLESAGARAATETLARQYASQARAAITRMQLTKKYQDEFEQLVESVTERTH